MVKWPVYSPSQDIESEPSNYDQGYCAYGRERNKL